MFTIACVSFAAGQVRPNADWQQIETPNFTIVYEAGLDSLARHAALRAEHEHAVLSQTLARAPAAPIYIVLSDNNDQSNGAAQPLPANRITIWVRPPVDELSLQNYDDWLDLVLSHELTHIFQLDAAGPVGRAIRSIFGRVPFPWPIFPAFGITGWNVEGLATFIESRNTGAGRVAGSYSEMVVRTASLEDEFPTIDRISGETPLWPGGFTAYIYGSLFMDYIARRYGDDAHRALIGRMSGSLLPPPWRMDGVAKSALGRSYSDLYDDWRLEIGGHYTALRDTLVRAGLTTTETVSTTGRWALFPRVARDGRRLAYTDENGRDVTATRIIDFSDSTDTRVRRNGLGRIAWLGDGSYITAQLDFTDPYSIGSDLYIVRAGRDERLTQGARAEYPDVGPDDRTLVYVQNVQGSNRLMLRDITSGSERVLVAASPDVQWTLPRFAPDGERIAAQKQTRGRGQDIVVLDLEGRIIAELGTPATDAAPAWSADGRYVIFASDRSGISNLYAQPRDGGALRQITNVLGGAFQPDVSPDGRSIYFAAYHADGFHIERMPYDPGRWFEPLRAAPPSAQRPDTLMRRATEPAPPFQLDAARAYSPLRSLLPKFWFPSIALDSVAGEFIGISTWGEDVVGRHAYDLTLGYDPWRERVAGHVQYTWAGLGNPVIALELAREWDNTGLVRVVGELDEVIDTVSTFEREDRVALTATTRLRHWRASSSFQLGVEGVRLRRKASGVQRSDPQDEMIGVVAGAAFANYRYPSQAISPEDGVRAGLTLRRRFEIDPLADRDQSYTQITAATAAYKSAGGSGFAHNVIAARANLVHRTALGAGPTDIGGANGFLPVRGYTDDARIGFSAWSASLEYRMPLAFIARGYRLRPVFIDRMSGTFFLDAGNASCTEEQSLFYLSCAGNAGREDDVLLGGGFEVAANVALLSFAPSWVRLGVGFPFSGDVKTAQVYFTITPAF